MQQASFTQTKDTGMYGIRWIVLAIIVTGGSIMYFLRYNVSIIGDTMIQDLGMNEYQLGLVFSSFALGYALFQFPGGLIGDKLGPRVTITGIAVAWVFLTIALGVVPGSDVWSVTAIVATLVVIRFLVGITNGPFFPVTLGGTVMSWFPVKQWGVAGRSAGSP